MSSFLKWKYFTAHVGVVRKKMRYCVGVIYRWQRVDQEIRTGGLAFVPCLGPEDWPLGRVRTGKVMFCWGHGHRHWTSAGCLSSLVGQGQGCQDVSPRKTNGRSQLGSMQEWLEN